MKVLDHGYIKIVETWGSDERIIEAARMSTDKGFQGWGPIHYDYCPARYDTAAHCACEEGPRQGDEKLLRYLWVNHHATPFEMAGAIIEVQAPIFVFREWHRHRTQSYNELSARYTPLPDVNYVPTTDRCIAVTSSNKQAASLSLRTPTHEEVLDWLWQLQHAYSVSQEVYARGLQIGIPKEVARLPVPVARYSRMRASANLRNWLSFLTLRMDLKAQYEIREYANSLRGMLLEIFPRTLSLFDENRHG
jgi:thymidylate synthase (FAD)